jgi:hypothetical protein
MMSHVKTKIHDESHDESKTPVVKLETHPVESTTYVKYILRVVS